MTKYACTPANATAKMAAMFEAGGIKADLESMSFLGDDAERVYHELLQDNGYHSLKNGNNAHFNDVDALLDSSFTAITDNSKKAVMGVHTQGLKPTDIFPSDLTEPVLDYIDNFVVKHGANLAGNRSEYVSGFKRLLKDIDSKQYGAEVEGEFARWAADIAEGYPFYGKGGNVLTKAISNVGANSLAFSGNIVAGNPFEIIVKMPTIYGIENVPRSLGKALELTKGNLWAKLPEVEARGYYGYKEPIRKNAAAVLDLYRRFDDAYMNLTNRPLTNLAYATGVAKGKTTDAGLEAIEKIAFRNRIGNDSRITRNAMSGNAIRMLNYTLGSYHMLGGMMLKMVKPSSSLLDRANAARGLATYYGLTAAIGGQAAAIPEPLAWVLGSYDEGFKDWEKENLNPLGKLIRAGSMGSLFITGQMLNRAWQRAAGSFEDGFSKLGEEDIVGAAMDFGDAGLSFSTLLPKNPTGNPRVQGVIRDARKLFEGDEDIEEFQKKTTERFFPFTKTEEE